MARSFAIFGASISAASLAFLAHHPDVLERRIIDGSVVIEFEAPSAGYALSQYWPMQPAIVRAAPWKLNDLYISPRVCPILIQLTHVTRRFTEANGADWYKPRWWWYASYEASGFGFKPQHFKESERGAFYLSRQNESL